MQNAMPNEPLYRCAAFGCCAAAAIQIHFTDAFLFVPLFVSRNKCINACNIIFIINLCVAFQ